MRVKEIISMLNIDEESFRKMVEEIVIERFNEGYAPTRFDNYKDYMYRIDLFNITRSNQFRELVLKNGYDCMETIEEGNLCYGIVDSSIAKILKVIEIK